MGFFDRIQKPGHVGLVTKQRETYQASRDIDTTKIVATARSAKDASTRCSPKPTTYPGVRKSRHDTLRGSRECLSHSSQRRRRDSVDHGLRLDADDDDDDTGICDEDLTARIDEPWRRCRQAHNRISLTARDLIAQHVFMPNLVDSAIEGLVHGADIAPGPSPAANYEVRGFASLESSSIWVRYPSTSLGERYHLVSPRQKDDFDPMQDILYTIEIVIADFLSPTLYKLSYDQASNLHKALKRSYEHSNMMLFSDLVAKWNVLMRQEQIAGNIATQIRTWTSIDPDLTEFILTQTYARTVSQRVNELRRYTNGTDDVYGELLPRMISKMLKEDTGMRSDQIFVDLGSGVGNCVLQAALEVGCESWGCEKMQTASDLAYHQKEQFEVRCKLWGISHGSVHLEKGDFLENEPIRNILRKADVVLVNNQAFQADLNEHLTNLFLDLKDGARIISLKSFRVDGKSQAKSKGAVFNIFKTIKKEYFANCVSWTDAPGSYYVSMKNSANLVENR